MLLAPLHVLPHRPSPVDRQRYSFVVSSAWSATGASLLQALLARGATAYGIDLTTLREPGPVGDRARRSFADFLERMSVVAVLPGTPADHETLAHLGAVQGEDRYLTPSADTLARMDDPTLLAEAFGHAGQPAPDGSHPDSAPYIAVTFRAESRFGPTHVWLYRWTDGRHELVRDSDLLDEPRARVLDLVSTLDLTGVATFGLTIPDAHSPLVLSARPGFTPMSAHCAEVTEYLLSRFTEV